MAITRHYLEEKEFLISKLDGELNDDNLMEHIMAHNKLTEHAEHLMELGDCRGITDVTNLTVHGTTRSAKIERHRPDSRLAILIHDNDDLLYQKAFAYQTFAEARRKEVRIFKNLTSAVTWLAKDSGENEAFTEYADSVLGATERV